MNDVILDESKLLALLYCVLIFFSDIENSDLFIGSMFVAP